MAGKVTSFLQKQQRNTFAIIGVSSKIQQPNAIFHTYELIFKSNKKYTKKNDDIIIFHFKHIFFFDPIFFFIF